MKKIIAFLLLFVLCFLLVSCEKNEESITYKTTNKSIMDYETVSISGEYFCLNPAELKELSIENRKGFVIKARATEEYENVLQYSEEQPVYIEQYTGKIRERLEEIGTNKNGEHTASFVRPDSYLLTSMEIESIYYCGSGLNLKEGSTIQVAEGCYIAAKSSFLALLQDDSEKVLYTNHDMIKFEPGKEYVIFGYEEKSFFKKYYSSAGKWEGIYPVDDKKPDGFYDSENGEKVIKSCIDSFSQHLLDEGYNKEFVYEE